MNISPIARLMAVLCLSLTACPGTPSSPVDTVVIPKRVELAAGGSKVLNYTPWYIHTFEIQGPRGSGIHGGGPNVQPMREDGEPSGGAKEMCCTTYPAEWQPDLTLTVRWLAFKDVKTLGAKAPGTWYKAENVRIAPYQRGTYGVWAIYLPGDRVRIMITDGNEGGNDPNNRPSDNDPYIAHGIPDNEWNYLFPNGVARGLE